MQQDFPADSKTLAEQREPENPDLMSWLLDAEINDKNSDKWGPTWLAGDTRLIVVAGRYGFAVVDPRRRIRFASADSDRQSLLAANLTLFK